MLAMSLDNRLRDKEKQRRSHNEKLFNTFVDEEV